MKKALRLKVFRKYDGHCAYCGKNMKYKDMQVDHLTPQNIAHLYGSNKRVREYMELDGIHINSFENLMPSCRRCNHYKRAHRLEEFRINMQTLHERIIKTYLAKVAIDYGIIKIKPFDGQFYYEKLRG